MILYSSAVLSKIPKQQRREIIPILLDKVNLLDYQNIRVKALSRSTILGYMCSIIYLILNMMTKNKYVGNFYIMSMKYKSFNEKYWLLAGSIIVIFMSILIKLLRRKIE